jgi:hypothetical protein
MRFDFEHEPKSSATNPMFYGWTTYLLRYKDENYIYLLLYYFLLYTMNFSTKSNQINIIFIFFLHSFLSDPLLVIRNS